MVISKRPLVLRAIGSSIWRGGDYLPRLYLTRLYVLSFGWIGLCQPFKQGVELVLTYLHSQMLQVSPEALPSLRRG
jgi:hypothetical protein